MVELSYKQIGTFLMLVLALSTGTTIYLSDSGRNRTCSTGWDLITDGEYEGMYDCESRPGKRYHCYGIRDSANTPAYWCDEGQEEGVCQLIEVKTIQQYNGGIFDCEIDTCALEESVCTKRTSGRKVRYDVLASARHTELNE